MGRHPDVEVLLLGPLEVRLDGSSVDVGGPKQRTALACVAFYSPEPVTVETLMEAVWGPDPPDGALRSLRTYMSNLRVLLGDGLRLSGRRGTYRAQGEGFWTDVLRLEMLLDQASGAGLSDRRSLYDEAMTLWRGPPLADLDGEWVVLEAGVLEAQYRRTIAGWAETTIESGHGSTVVPRLQGAVDAYPFDEELCLLLMVALDASGRHADALAAFRRLEAHLGEELGLIPGPDLRTLEQQILVHDSPFGRRDRPADSNLPVPPTSLIGRDASLDELMDWLSEVRVLTLTGPGGVGKTRLAIELGRRILESTPREVWWVDLSSLRDADAVDAVVTRSLRIQPAAGATPLSGVIEHLRNRVAVVIIDNCEHLTPNVARSIATIVRACAGVTVVATSRAALHIDGESEWRVPPLEIDPEPSDAPWSPALRLLLRRAPPSFQMTSGNTGGLVELCRRLDGLPLALELAASRLGSMAPGDIVAESTNRTEPLVSVEEGRGSRHETLTATIDWSYALLGDGPRRLLLRLGVMARSFLFADLVAICSEPGETTTALRESLTTLVDWSLVVADTSRDKARYHLLETIRRFALDRLGDTEPGTRDRHARHFADLAEREAARLLGARETEAVEALNLAHDDLRSSIAWSLESGDIDTASQIVAALPDSAYWRSRYELSEWARRVWSFSSPRHPRWRAVCGTAARGAWLEGRYDDALEIAETATGHEGTVTARCGYPEDVIADVALYRGEAEVALGHYRRVATDAAAEGDAARLLWATYYQSVISSVLGRTDDARDAARVVLDDARRSRNPTALAFALYASGLAHKHTDPQEAIALFEGSVRSALVAENDWFAGVARGEWASTHAAHGDRRLACRQFSELIDGWYRAGDHNQLRLIWRYVTRVLAEDGLDDEAAVLVGALENDGSALAHPSPGMRSELERTLGVGRFNRLALRGSVMDISELVDLSREAIERAIAR